MVESSDCLRNDIARLISAYHDKEDVRAKKFVGSLEDFRRDVSLRLAEVNKSMGEIRTIFREFEARHKGDTVDGAVFAEGLQFYEQLLKVEAEAIMEALAHDTERVVVSKQERDKTEGKLLDALIMEVQNPIASSLSRKLEEAIKTMRKLPAHGYTGNGTCFEWPKSADLKQMLSENPRNCNKLRLASFSQHRDDEYVHNQNYRWIGGIQISLTNGQTSPIFRPQGHSVRELDRFEIPFSVKRVNGTNPNNGICHLHFFGDGPQVKIDTNLQHVDMGQEVVLEEGEELIGVYVTSKPTRLLIEGIGFIAWKPPRI